MCRSLEFGTRETKFYRKTDFLGFSKKAFSKKKSLGTPDARVLHIVEISTKFDFSNSNKGRCYFFRLKSSDKIETVQYCQKRFFVNYF